MLHSQVKTCSPSDISNLKSQVSNSGAPLRFGPPPERCERLAELAPRFGGSVEVRSAALSVDYALPAHASNEVRAFWRSESRVDLEPELLARLPGGRVFGAGSVMAPDGKSIARDVSPDFGKALDEHWLLTYAKIGPPQLVSGTTAVIATTMGNGYSHWLLDELPRLLALPRGEADSLIAHATLSFSQAALKHWGWTGNVLEADRSAHFQCEQLLVPSLIGTVAYPTRRGLDLIAEFTAPFHAESSVFGERLYITRENARRRKVVNEAELWTGLQSAGFSNVRLEELTWPEQINAFRQAKMIVAPHGAGLANLAFCRPGTIVIELFNRSYVPGCFWRLAALQQLDYRPVIRDSAEPLAQTSTNNRLDLMVDLSQVRAALD